MKTMPASHTLYGNRVYGNRALEETEFALAISPCPQIEESRDVGENTELVGERSGLGGRRQAQWSRQTVLDNHDFTENLTIGWAIALAVAVALVVYVSGS
jgi:hypothetical protein